MNKMKLWKFAAVFLVVLVFTALVFYGKNTKKQEVCFENYCFSVELAQNDEERGRGLMFVENLESNRGMLFIFETEGQYNFWMENTLIPLDIIWIDKNKEVVFIKNNAQPCVEDSCPQIISDREAKYVLEINAGLAEEIGLTIGSKLRF